MVNAIDTVIQKAIDYPTCLRVEYRIPCLAQVDYQSPSDIQQGSGLARLDSDPGECDWNQVIQFVRNV